MPLYTLAVIDQHGMGRPVIQALVYREDQTHLQMLLRCAMNWAGQDVFISDSLPGRQAASRNRADEIAAVQAVLHDNSIFLCRFHVVKAFVTAFRKSSLATSQQEALYTVPGSMSIMLLLLQSLFSKYYI